MSRFRMNVGEKPRTVCVQAQPEIMADIFRRMVRYSSHQGPKSLERVEKDNLLGYGFRFWGIVPIEN